MDDRQLMASIAGGDEAALQALLRRFRGHMLGVVTDVRYPRDGRLASDAGLRLTEEIHAADPYMPVIIASTEQANRARAMRLGAMFIDKESKTMPQDLRAAVRRNFGFGDFVVYDPDTGLELMRIRNLAELQKSIFDIPDRALFTLCSTNAVSRWLNSRALFPIADAIEKRHFTELGEAPAVRRLVFDAIVAYRRMKNRGVVAIYRRDRFDRYSNFARIGQGSMGGKGRGLAFIDSCLKRIPAPPSPYRARWCSAPTSSTTSWSSTTSTRRLSATLPTGKSSTPSSAPSCRARWPTTCGRCCG